VTTMIVNEAVCEALFASSLQPSDTLTAEAVADAIGSTLCRLGQAGCASRMAEEFGDHPFEATDRMRWIRELTGELSALLYFSLSVPASSGSSAALLPVRQAA
jgi:hypothetical protein